MPDRRSCLSVKNCKKFKRYKIFKIYNFKFKNNSFDCVIAIHLYTYSLAIYQALKNLKEFQKMIKT